MTDLPLRLQLKFEWGGRKSSLSRSADDIGGYLDELRTVTESLGGWTRDASRGGAALRPVATDKESLVREFKAQAEEDKKMGGHLAGQAHFRAWNGRHVGSVRIRVSTGLVGDGVFLPNEVVIDYPVRSEDLSPYDFDEVLAAIDITANWFDPSWGSLADFPSELYEPPNEETLGEGPYLGWLTYLRSDRLGRLDDLADSGLEIIKLDYGAVFALGRDAFAVTSEDLFDLKAKLMSIDALGPVPLHDPWHRAQDQGQYPGESLA